VDYVGVDNVAAAVAATEHLIEGGRRRIAAIGLQPHLSNDTARQRLEGYRRALAAAGMPADPALEIPVQALHRTDGAQALRRLLRLDAPPDAVFCFNDQLALGALRAGYDAGLRVPADLGVVGFDDIEDGAYSIPSLTTIAPDKRQIAAQAIDCLAERLSGPDPLRSADPQRSTDRGRSTDPQRGPAPQRPARSVITGHRLVVRESTGPR
jgi:DNA-binding LacI/PurR family transcriptional regulator